MKVNGNPYMMPQQNVFQAHPLDKQYLCPDLIVDLWYYIQVDWKTLEGPFNSKFEADVHFQDYVQKLRCPSCGDE